jgi:MFS family permease
MNLRTYLYNIYNKRLHALTHRDFRIYWLGQCISLLGTWMQNIGLAWLVFSMTDSPLLLGLLETARFLPVTLFSLFAGVIIDKYPKRKILLITQAISMILAFILAALVFTGMVKYEYVLILALVLGFSNTIDMPARQSFTVEMTGKEDLMNAIALGSVTFNLARIIGPAIGALVLALWGAGWCFLFNGLSFMAVAASLLRIEAKPYVRKEAERESMLKEIKDGLKYIAGERLLIQTVLFIVISGIFVYNYEILIPVLTKNVLYQDEKVYGLLMSSLGLGSLLGAMMISMRGRSKAGSTTLFIGSVTVSMLLILIGLARIYYITIILLIVSGITNVWFSTNANLTLQLTAKDEYRGRVMSVFSLVNSGTAPLGYMLSGAAAGSLGADRAFLLFGAAAVVLAVLIKVFFHIKEKYEMKCS